ncbi:MAG: hypothetical protein NC300_08780 [Bacteroidales bacterium]|nr:hypothetical protein [Clostridium sp.]MCM1204224.1 hypothetical protein [Bacteroidales bacterium]
MNILETVKDTISDICTSVEDFFTDEISVTRKSLMTVGAVCALVGIVWGFVLSPIKKGIYINIANNGNMREEDDK